jgi:hypothetical protein
MLFCRQNNVFRCDVAISLLLSRTNDNRLEGLILWDPKSQDAFQQKVRIDTGLGPQFFLPWRGFCPDFKQAFTQKPKFCQDQA